MLIESTKPLLDLHLNLKAIYFDQIKEGTKLFENRLCNPYWFKRIEGRRYRNIILKKGYPKADDKERILVVPYIGWHKETITHEHFGTDPVEVYALDVSGKPIF